MVTRRQFIFAACAGLAAAIMGRFAPKHRFRAFLRQEDIQAAWEEAPPGPVVPMHTALLQLGDPHAARGSYVPVAMLRERWWVWGRIFITQEQIRRESRQAAKVINFAEAYGGGIRKDYYATVRIAPPRWQSHNIQGDLAELEKRLAASHFQT